MHALVYVVYVNCDLNWYKRAEKISMRERERETEKGGVQGEL